MSDSPSPSFGAIVTLFRDIAILRRGPEDLPASRVLLVLAIAGSMIAALVISSILPPLPVQANAEDHSIAVMLIDLVVTLAWCWAMLRIAGKPERFLQTATALFGFQLVMQPLLVPAGWALGKYGMESLWALPVVVLGVWVLAGAARIMKAATEWGMLPCLALVMGQDLLTYSIALTVFPGSPK